MRYQDLILAALVSAVVAQETPTLLAALNSTADLSTLNQTIGLLPAQVQTALVGATNVTILAPNNAAFEAANVSTNDTTALANVILYHVLDGTYESFNTTPVFAATLLDSSSGETTLPDGQVVEGVNGSSGNATFYSGYRQNATAVAGPIAFTGGLIYIIDTVLTIPGSVSDTAIEAGLSSLAGYLTNASLVQTLDTADQVTIFAPNNAAFQNIGTLLESGNVTAELLTSILQYHVISSSVLYSTDLSNGTSVATLQGGSVTVRLFEEDGETQVYVNNARVILPDVLVENGVVHVIDEVLNPENATATADPSTGSGTPAFAGAGESENEPGTSGVPSPTRTTPVPTATSTTTTSNPAWTVAPTGLGLAVLAGVALVL